MKFRNLMWKYCILGLLILYALFAQKLFAQTSVTPEPAIIEKPILLINEVQFKNTKNDWIEIYVLKGGSIINLQLKDDSVFMELNENLEVQSGDYILVYFKSDVEKYEKNGNLHKFNITKSGLTGTTEQIILISDNNIEDVVCWTNDSPTNGEIEDFNDINENWSGDQISSCINSDEINSGDSIFRFNLIDSDSKYDWIKSEIPTEGTFNIIQEECICECEEIICEETTCEDKINENQETEENFNNPECWSSIMINEIFPNPSGSDTDNEWIEIYNNSDSNCNLTGLYIDDIDGGSKAFEITENIEIKAKSYFLFPSWQTKIILNNTEDSVRIINSENAIIDEISYEKTIEDQSFAKNTEENFLWTDSPTPLTENIFNEEILSEEAEDNQNEEEKKEEETVFIGTSSNNIEITEIFPNPNGKDTGNEWVEIYNNSEESINLVNWVIKTSEEAKKKYIFGDKVLDAFEYFTISDKELGLSLKNNDGEVYLIDHRENIIDFVSYDQSEENKSFSKINISNGGDIENEWEWTEEISPNSENLNLFKYKGEIISFDKEKGLLEFKTEDLPENIQIKILQSGEEKFEFKNNTIANVTLKKNKDNNYLLVSHEIISKSEIAEETKGNNFLYLLLSSLPPLGFLSYMGLKKFNILKFA